MGKPRGKKCRPGNRNQKKLVHTLMLAVLGTSTPQNHPPEAIRKPLGGFLASLLFPPLEPGWRHHRVPDGRIDGPVTQICL